MKKALLLSLLILFSNNSYSQSVAIDGVGVQTEKATNSGALGRTLGWGIKKVFTTPIKIPGKVIGACLLSKKICASIAAGSISLAYLYDHPEVVEHYLEIHPEKYDEVQKYFEYRKSQTQDSEQIAKYDQASEDIGLNARTITEQLDIESNDTDWSNIYIQLISIFNNIDSKQELEDYSKNCSIEYTKQLVLMSSADFNNSINIYLPKINNNQPVLFNFDKYENLKSKKGVMESDHIPSYKALEWFFVNKSILPQNPPKQVKLNKNATAINLSYLTHRNNRTTGDKNIILSKNDGKNSKSLRDATLKDFATILWLENNNQNNINLLINSFIQIYVRNKLLCLYDLDNNNNTTYQQGYQNLQNFDVINFLK